MTVETPRDRGQSERILPDAVEGPVEEPKWTESQLQNELRTFFKTDAARAALLKDTPLLVDLARRNTQVLLERILQANLPVDRISLLSDRFAKLGAFFAQLKMASQFLAYSDGAENKIQTAAFKLLHGSNDIINLCRSIFEDEGTVVLNGHTIKILDWRGFWVAFNEIFFSEDYYFSSSDSDAVIIDGGANIGLATYYFHSMYPKARILSFEPSERIQATLRHNVAQLFSDNITVFGCALAKDEGVLEFATPRGDSLGGSLFSERLSADTDIERVQAKRLRDWLVGEKSIQFIKLDIEGAELDVLQDIEDQLHKVENIFIEYHGSACGLPHDFVEILSLLSKNQFRFHTAKAMSTEKYTSQRPFTHLEGRYSQTIFAKKNHELES